MKKKRTHLSVWGRPRSIQLNLLDREYSQGVHFGFGMGLNMFDFSSIETTGATVKVPQQGNAILYADLTMASIGYNINAIMDYRLNKNFNVRLLPGIFFGQRQLDFYREDTRSIVQSMNMSSNYFEVPLQLKYSASRYTNFRTYMIGGLNGRINLNNTVNEGSERYIGMKKFEPFGEAGFGFDYYLNNFRMGFEFKLSIGLINNLDGTFLDRYEAYSNSLKYMRSNMAVVTLNFEL